MNTTHELFRIPIILANADEFATLVLIGAIISSILWLVIGWRAMKAHERIANAASEWIQLQKPSRNPNQRPPRPQPAENQPPQQ